MMIEDKKVLLVFCDARLDKENSLLIHIGVVNVVAVINNDFIEPKYVHSYYQKDRISRSISETPFYELFSIAEGLENLARIKEKVEGVVVFNDCSGTIDLLTRLGERGSSVSFKHKSLYLECLGKGYNPSVKFRWLRRSDEGMRLADFIGRSYTADKSSHEKIVSMSNILISKRYSI